MARIQGAHRRHSELVRRNLPAHNPLKPHHNHRRHIGGINRGMRHRTMGRPTMHNNLNGITTGQGGPLLTEHRAGRPRDNMLSQEHIRAGDTPHKPVVKHCKRTGTVFLRRLEQRDNRPPPLIPIRI